MPFETTLRKQFRRGFVWPRLIDMECHTLWIRKDEEIACSWTHEVERAVNAEASVAEILGKCRGRKPSCSRVFSGKPLMRPRILESRLFQGGGSSYGSACTRVSDLLPDGPRRR